MAEHKYAQVLRWIADGESVEGRIVGGDWNHVGMFNNDANKALLNGFEQDFPVYEFRIKPKTVKIGNREVEAPVLNLVDGVDYFVIYNHASVEPVSVLTETFVRSAAARGMVFSGKDSAVAAREAITALLTGKE